MNASFDGFSIGQRLQLPEIDENVGFNVTGIFPGGMGVCLRVENEQTHEVLALKGVQKKMLQDPRAVSRFIKELDLWYAASSCDGVVLAKGVTVFNSIPYMASEWVASGDLSNVVAKMMVRDKVRVFLEVAETLGFVYDKFNVIHRDLKPQNILIHSDGRAVVSDWGLAKIYGDAVSHDAMSSAEGSADVQLTVKGSYLGTVLYMSPEQIKDASSVDFRSDIYSLGCILYELETGKPPFVEGGVRGILSGHLYKEPIRLGGLFNRTNLGLEKVIERCLRKDPAERYQSYRELVEDVKRRIGRRLPEYHVPALREERAIPGVGARAFQKEVARRANGKGVAIIDFSKAKEVLKEAEMFLATNRPEKAVGVLRQFDVCAQLIKPGDEWNICCDIVLNYAYALSLTRETEQSLVLYRKLEGTAGQPATFYLNYSYANLTAGKPEEVKRICLVGIERYPKEDGLWGNLTDAYIMLGDADNAIESAQQTVKVGGVTVQACEEVNLALRMKSNRLRKTDIRQWGEVLRQRYSWIRRGLTLNPIYQSLKHAELMLIAEIDPGKGVLKAKEILADKMAGSEIKQLAFGEWATNLKEWCRTKGEKEQKDALGTLQNYTNAENLNDFAANNVRDAYYFILLNFFCLYVEPRPPYFETVTNYYLNSPVAKKKDGSYRLPIEVAQILSVLDRHDEACRIIQPEAESGDLYAQRIYVSMLIQAGDFNTAIGVARSGIAMMPQNCDAWDTLERAYRAAGMFADADAAKRKADEMFELEEMIKAELRELIKPSMHS